jgi:hypothetical protein
MGMYLRQVCLVASELEPAINELTTVLGIERCYVDSGVAKFGLENTLMAVGTNFLEVVAPVEENTAAGRYLDRRGGDGGYILVCQVDNAEHQQQCRNNAASLDVRVAFASDNGSYHLMQLHPADLKNAMWEIDWDERAEIDGEWEPAGGITWKENVRDDVTAQITGVELQSTDPAATAAQWGTIAGVEPEQLADGYRLKLENGELRFVGDLDGRGAGLSGVDLLVRDRAAIMAAALELNAPCRSDYLELCGTRFYLSDTD